MIAELAAKGYEPVIGLEIHVQLQTQTKMFCGCRLSFGDEPNTHVCPVCLGHPGTLPTVNAQAIQYGLMVAEALGCEIAPRSIFHRKNYFYPDLPKGYQISQYDIPLGSAGTLGGVRVHRVHLEEDAAKLTHVGESGRIHGSGSSMVDFNRGGTPLLEIVSEPDIETPAQAREWLQLLRTTVRQIGVSDANMEEGSLRCDANVSIRRPGAELGVKTELKNLDSLRFLERGVEAELARQLAVIEAGDAVEQATMHYDPSSGSLTTLRSKEQAHDYRYFPEPDLVPVVPTETMLREAREALPELPGARHERYRDTLGLSDDVARLLAFDDSLGGFYEQVLAADPAPDAQAAAKWVTGDLVARVREHGHDTLADAPVTPQALAELIAMVQAGEVSNQAARDVLGHMVADGRDPATVVEAEGLGGVSDSSELDAMVERAMEANPDAVQKIRNGEMKAIGPIIGAVMREAQGRADGKQVTAIVREKLGLG
ncbi:MAG: Asp-tRNA(Asn)/Glu-tRNA(Gln) amidotransferase subunit GatB [Solirubrobacterales bacterium]